MLQLCQFEEERSSHGLLLFDTEYRLVVDSTVCLKSFKKGFNIVGDMSEVRGGSLSFLITAVIALNQIDLSLFLKSLKDHFCVGFSFAHGFKFELVIKH